MKFRTGTLYTRILAHFVCQSHRLCLLCHQPDSQIHLLSACQNAWICSRRIWRKHTIFT